MVGAIALLVAALLNAETIRSTFDRMPQGSTVRSVGLRLTDPLYDVSPRCASTGRVSGSMRCGGAIRVAKDRSTR